MTIETETEIAELMRELDIYTCQVCGMRFLYEEGANLHEERTEHIVRNFIESALRPPQFPPEITVRVVPKGRPILTTFFIKEYLVYLYMSHPELCYPYFMWRILRAYCERRKPSWRCGTYTVFSRYIYMLKRLGLIIPVGKPAPTKLAKGIKKKEQVGIKKQVYTVVSRNLTDIRWVNPQKALWTETYVGRKREHKTKLEQLSVG